MKPFSCSWVEQQCHPVVSWLTTQFSSRFSKACSPSLLHCLRDDSLKMSWHERLALCITSLSNISGNRMAFCSINARGRTTGSMRNLSAFWGRGAMSNCFASGWCKQREFAALRKLWSRTFQRIFLGFDPGKPCKKTAQKSSSRRARREGPPGLLTFLSLWHLQPRGFLNQRQHLRSAACHRFSPCSLSCCSIKLWFLHMQGTSWLVCTCSGKQLISSVLTLPPVLSPSYAGKGNESSIPMHFF